MPDPHTASGTDRFVTLDVLRGFAVMGIVAMNIVGFAWTADALMAPPKGLLNSLADKGSFILSFVFIDGKMRGLFSLLFGASMMVVIDRATASGQSAASVHYRRIGWLAVFGLIHFFLIWNGDILFLYAVSGAVAFAMHKWHPRNLIVSALAAFAIGCAVMMAGMGALLLMQVAAAAPDADVDTVKTIGEVTGELARSAAEESAAYRGSYLDVVRFRLANADVLTSGLIYAVIETIPLMMLGMAFVKNGFLTGQQPDALYRRRAVLWGVLGLTLAVIPAVIVWQSDFDTLILMNAMAAWAIPSRLMLTVAYASILILLAKRAAGTAWLERVSAVGRAAFTNYLGTSIILTTVFYGYGLGLTGRLSMAMLWPFVIGVWIVMLLWSKPWLDRFHYGPLEWVWRSLARGSRQPMRRVTAV